MTESTFRAAAASDLPQVLELLKSANLPLDGVEEHLSSFLLAFRAGLMAGCAAVERYGETGLLRSVAVADGLRNTGLGTELVARLLDNERATGTRSLVLLTKSATAYFARFGFRTIGRSEAPPAVQASVQFQGVCPDSATVMRLDLDGGQA
jgi:amino-acid N-acetyltransferase